jgi:hypothetical protein
MTSEVSISPPGGGRRHRRRLTLRLATLAVALLTFGAALSIMSAPASANSYNALLNAGTLNQAYVASNIYPLGAGQIAAINTWTAPAGETFAGFAYTAATFYADQSSYGSGDGGLSAGFYATGTPDGNPLVFPWTNDCTIANHTGNYTNGQYPDCWSAGNTTGWNYDNAELADMNGVGTGANPQETYTTLNQQIWCNAASCKQNNLDITYAGAGAGVTNLSAVVDDTNGAPQASESWSGANSTSWYTTNVNSPTLTIPISDPSGICYLAASLSGGAASSGDLVASPSTSSSGLVDLGAPIGEEFAADQPCAGSGTYRWTLPSDFYSGTYTASVAAANAGQYEAAGYTSSNPGASTVANGLQINVDNTVPTVEIAPAPGTSTTATATVISGPSGVNLTCTVDGASVTPTLVGGNATSAGTTTWDVPDYEQLGVKCTAANNDVNQALSTTAVDYSDVANVEGEWDGASQDVGVTATTYNGTNEGIGQCSLDDSFAGTSTVLQLSGSAFTDSTNAQAAANCQSNDLSSATYGLWVDTQTPQVTFTGVAATDAQKGISVHSLPTIGIVGSENQTLSAVTKVVCTVDGGDQTTLQQSTAGATTDGGLYDFLPTLGNGTHVIACTPTTGAGKTSAAADETLKVDDPNQEPNPGQVDAYGASPDINSGGAVYSPAASSGWQRSAQTLTIRADHTGGLSPIVKISCSNAVFAGGADTATITGPADASNGIDATVTVDGANQHLACTATDDAGDSFPLGTWTGEIDGQGANGSFVAQAQWPSPSAIEINAVDANGVVGSGVATVDLHARNVKTGVNIDLGPANSESGELYEITSLPDGELPAGRYSLSAVITDAAGNVSTVAGPTLQFPLRQSTKLTFTAGKGRAKRSAEQQPATPAAVADANEVTAHAALPATWAGGELTPAARAAISVANASARIAKATTKNTKAKVSVPTIKLRYGQKLTITGKLTNTTKRGAAVKHVPIRIYAKVNGSGTITLLHSVRTGEKGMWRYRVKAGVSRVLYVTYPGNSTLRSATDELRQAFSGKVTIDTSSAFIAGNEVTLTGRVQGGHIPTGGVHLQIWYTIAGSRAPFTHWMDVTSKPNGRWRYSFRLNDYTAGLTYEFEVRVRGQSGWPYRGAMSRPAVKAIG